MTTNTADQAITIPVTGDPATIPAHISTFIGQMESRLVKRYVNDADRTARNPTPVAGEMSYLTTPGRFDRRQGAVWMEAFPLFARKANEAQVVNNSVAFVNDDQLQVPLLTGGVYEFRCMIIHESGTTADFAAGPIMVSGTASSIDWQTWNFSTAGAFDMNNFTSSNTFAVSGGSGSFDPFYMTGLVICTASGNFGVRWSQNALQVVNTRVKIGSFLVAQRVA